MNKLDDTLIQKPLKCPVSKEKNMNQNFYVHCYLIGLQGNSLQNNVSIYLNKKFS